MIGIFTVAFFGHRYVDDIIALENLLEKQIYKIISEKEYVDFLVGRNGDFDLCAASSVVRIRKKYRDDNSAIVLVLPYATAEYIKNEEAYLDYYTDVEISDSASNAHPKSAIQIRNREMVDRADLIICYIDHKSGGAWKTVKYAIEQGKDVINLAESCEVQY